MRYTSASIGCVIALLGLAATRPAAGSCARTQLDDYVGKGRDLLIGETHGTVEGPALVRCLVLTALASPRREPLVVSIEHTPAARDLKGSEWRSHDGRSSIAMWQLAEFLFEQERRGHLTVAFHMPESTPSTPDGAGPDFAMHEKLMGAPWRALAQKNLLIALVGNLHSRKSRPDWFPHEPAGTYAGDSVVHVYLDAVGPGEAWSSENGEYKRVPTGGALFAGQKAGTLVDGSVVEHDFVYLVPGFTASGPKFP